MYTKLLKIADEELKPWHNLVSNCWTPLYAGPVTHARTEGLTGQVSKVPHLGVDLQSEEEPESGMRGEGVELLLQLHQPLRGQVDVLQQHPAGVCVCVCVCVCVYEYV